MKVIAENCARGDILLFNGSRNSVGSRWMEDRLDGRGYRPKDLSGWTARFVMSYAGRTVYEQDGICTDKGLVAVEIPPGALGMLPSSYQGGEYRIEASSPDGSDVRRVAEGYWQLS